MQCRSGIRPLRCTAKGPANFRTPKQKTRDQSHHRSRQRKKEKILAPLPALTAGPPPSSGPQPEGLGVLGVLVIHLRSGLVLFHTEYVPGYGLGHTPSSLASLLFAINLHAEPTEAPGGGHCRVQFLATPSAHIYLSSGRDAAAGHYIVTACVMTPLVAARVGASACSLVASAFTAKYARALAKEDTARSYAGFRPVLEEVLGGVVVTQMLLEVMEGLFGSQASRLQPVWALACHSRDLLQAMAALARPKRAGGGIFGCGAKRGRAEGKVRDLADLTGPALVVQRGPLNETCPDGIRDSQGLTAFLAIIAKITATRAVTASPSGYQLVSYRPEGMNFVFAALFPQPGPGPIGLERAEGDLEALAQYFAFLEFKQIRPI
jgi:hypothetical protein